MISFRDEVSSRRLTLRKFLYHPLTLVALGIHIALILAPLNISRLPVMARLFIGLALLLIGLLVSLVWPWRTNALSRPDAFKKILYHPLTWAAVGFHLLLLTVPFSTEPSAVVEEEEAIAQEDEAMPIDLLNLSEIATSVPPPPQPEPVPPPPAAPPSPPSPSQTAASAPAVAPAPTAPVPQQPVANTPAPPVATPASSQPAANQPPAYDSTQDRGIFIQGLDAIGAMGLNDLSGQGLPLAESFPQGNANHFLGQSALATDYLNPVSVGEAGALPDLAVSARVIDSQPKDVLRKVESGYAGMGITFNPVPDYGAEPLYELKKPTGETFAFVSLVSFPGSTLMVLWQDNPNGSAGT